MRKKSCPWICVQNFKSIYWNTVEFCHFEWQKGLPISIFHYSSWFRHFLRFSIFSNWGRSKSILGSCFAFFTKIWPKKTYHTTRTLNLDYNLFDLVTSDGFDLTRGHQRLMMALRSIPDTINAISLVLSQPDEATLPDEASDDKKSTIWHLSWPVTSSVTFRWNFAVCSEINVRNYQIAVFGSRTGTVVWQMAEGGAKHPPPPSQRWAGSVNTTIVRRLTRAALGGG